MHASGFTNNAMYCDCGSVVHVVFAAYVKVCKTLIMKFEKNDIYLSCTTVEGKTNKILESKVVAKSMIHESENH